MVVQISKFLRLGLKVLPILLVASYIPLFFIKPPLPNESRLINTQLKPIQNNLKPQSETKQYGDFYYELDKLAEYEVSGLVVEQYTSSDILDLTHKNDPANTRDLCIIWGKNLDPEIYQKVKFSHGEFTCYVEWDSSLTKDFSLNELSNNHIIPNDPSISSKLNNVRVGDQVVLKGYLANYKVFHKDNGLVGTRNTSLTREDQGNGACEILLTTDIVITNSSSNSYYLAKTLLPYAIVLSILVRVIMFFIW